MGEGGVPRAPLKGEAGEEAIQSWVEAMKPEGIRFLQQLVQTASYSGSDGTRDGSATVAGQVFAAGEGTGRPRRNAGRPPGEIGAVRPRRSPARRLGIAMDGSYGWMPIIGHGGSVQFELRTHGRAAHASTPHLGASATKLGVDATPSPSAIRGPDAGAAPPGARTKPSRPAHGGRRNHDRGGWGPVGDDDGRGPRVDRSGVNTVPDWCQATIDIPFPPSYELSLRQTVAFINEVVEETLKEVPLKEGWSWRLLELGWHPPVALARHFEEAARLPPLRVARNGAAQLLGFEPHLETVPAGTDATFVINEVRIPTLVEFGPAGALSHDTHEYVEVDCVMAGAKILALTALDILGLAD